MRAATTLAPPPPPPIPPNSNPGAKLAREKEEVSGLSSGMSTLAVCVVASALARATL